ncbi:MULTISPECIES: DUF1289 domain-containing protein [Deefgea]|uniref:DUF1289 domain-containing protein n=1 Tax=Deefgea piscis TaxID=2739061 RepID=A0A6M8SXC0_9NEIS|nr:MULTISPECIES: DUF1289 domain-containing protein [Deefgea]MBM5573231.1 DUF1289 domain-containing protein [Deefgea sp. CFH1-16]QKJ67239.1 DUF1289 domain-containing protein [Deefgea piscis]
MNEAKERPDTPCVAVCSTGMGDDVCQGCQRTMLEVAHWVMLSEAEKEPIWQRLEQYWADKGQVPPWQLRGK